MKTTIKKIAEAWRKRQWGFYDLQFTSGFKNHENIECYTGLWPCYFCGEMTLKKGNAGLFPSGFLYECPNCKSRLDAKMIRKCGKLNKEILK